MTSSLSGATFVIMFGAVYAVAYVIAVKNNYALFTYHPALGELTPLVEPARDGPAIYRDGWMATAAIVAFVAATLARFITESFAQRLWSGWSWAVPIASMFIFSYMLSGFFTR